MLQLLKDGYDRLLCGFIVHGCHNYRTNKGLYMIIDIFNPHTCTVMRIVKLNIFPVPMRLHSGYGKLIFVISLQFFEIFMNVVHFLEPGETPSYSGNCLYCTE